MYLLKVYVKIINIGKLQIHCILTTAFGSIHDMVFNIERESKSLDEQTF